MTESNDDFGVLDAFAERGKQAAQKLGMTRAEDIAVLMAAYVGCAGQMAVATALNKLNGTLRQNYFG